MALRRPYDFRCAICMETRRIWSTSMTSAIRALKKSARWASRGGFTGPWYCSCCDSICKQRPDSEAA